MSSRYEFAWDQNEANGQGRLIWWIDGRPVMKAPIPDGQRKMCVSSFSLSYFDLVSLNLHSFPPVIPSITPYNPLSNPPILTPHLTQARLPSNNQHRHGRQRLRRPTAPRRHIRLHRARGEHARRAGRRLGTLRAELAGGEGGEYDVA